MRWEFASLAETVVSEGFREIWLVIVGLWILMENGVRREFPLQSFVTFHVSRRRREMYWSRASVCLCLSVCLSVCLSAAACPHYCTDPAVTWGSGSGCPLVVHCWVDLQSVHGLRCCGSITRTGNVSEYMLVLASVPSCKYHQYCHLLPIISTVSCDWLWPPCVADVDIIFLPCGFFLSSSADWMSTILPHMAWP